MAFVDGLHTREGVLADLEAIFDRNPSATVFLDDCRHAWGPFVQAGAVDFMERVSGEYHFQLVGDLGPGLARSNLGIVYPDSNAAETRKTLADVGHVFSRRLDPLRLLSREEELISTVNRTNQKLVQARRQSRRNDRIKERNSQIKERNSRLKKDNERLKKNNERLEENNGQLKENNGRLEERNSWLEQKNSQLTVHNHSRRYRLADALVGGVLRIPGLKGLLSRDKNPRDH